MGALLDYALFAGQQNPVAAARMYATSTQTVGTGTNSTAVFQTVDYDTSGNLIANTSNGTLTANLTGIWIVSFGVRWNTVASTSERAIGIFRNGNVNDRVTGANGFGSGYNVLICTTALRMAAGDYIQGLLWQGTGANLATNISFEPCQLVAAYVGPA